MPWQTQPIDLSKIAYQLPQSMGIFLDALIAGSLTLRLPAGIPNRDSSSGERRSKHHYKRRAW